MEKNIKKSPVHKIVVKACANWSSSYSRTMRSVGRAASAGAIQRAADNNIPISYISAEGKIEKDISVQ